MGGGVSRDRQEPSSRLNYGPQQVVFIPASQNPNVGGRAGTSNVPLQQSTDPRFGPQSEVPVPNPEAVPRLSVQQTCVVKNPVNLHKHSLKCFHDPSYPDRLFVSFLLDSTTEVDISVHYYAQQLTDVATGAPTFVSRLSRPTSESSRRFPAAMNQHFCTTAEEALLLSELQQQQAILDREDEDEDGGVYPITVCLRSVPPAQSSGAYQPTMVKNQYTFARILRAPRGGPATGTDSAAADASASSSAGNFGTSSPGQDWRAQIVKQKIQFGTRTFEVQEIFGIERGNSTEMQRLPSGTRGANVGATSGGDESDSKNSGDCHIDSLAGRECVICLAEERNTAVLPCRHMCLCSGCANIMRMQSNKCPICRQPVTSLLQITMKTNPE